MKRKAFKPSLRSLCAIGTVAHNRAFRPAELKQYLRFEENVEPIKVVNWLKRNKLVGEAERGRYWPTAKGWKMIERACAVRGRR